jgi:GT2 family glycosyltransferase
MTAPATPIAVLVSTHKRPDSLRRMLESVFRQTCPASAIHVIVFNDAGKDASSVMMESLFASRRDEGWGSLRWIDNAGPNIHIASARARLGKEAPADARVLVFADDDAILDPACLATLVRCLEEDPTIGAAGPRLRQWGAPERAAHTAGFVGRWTGRYSDVDSPTPMDCDWLNSTCVAIRRDAYDKTEGFWPGFHVAHAEVDMGLQLKEAGYRVVYWPAAVADHDVEMGTPKRERLYYIYRNKVHVIRRRFHGLNKAAALAVVVLWGTPRHLLESLCFHKSLDVKEWRMVFAALWDGLTGQGGARSP